MPITIVTALYDIGRKGWPKLARTMDAYFEDFKLLATLDNHIVVYTTEQFVDRIKEIRGNKSIDIIVFDLIKEHTQEIELIKNVQFNPIYRKSIIPKIKFHPRYNVPEYVLINCFKPLFLDKAVNNGLVNTDLVAWVDFGYIRSSFDLGNVTTWKYDFSLDKIHIFCIREIVNNIKTEEIIYTEDTYVIGGVVICPRSICNKYWNLTKTTFDKLIANSLCGTDQELTAITCTENLDLYQQHPIRDWREVIKKYNV